MGWGDMALQLFNKTKGNKGESNPAAKTGKGRQKPSADKAPKEEARGKAPAAPPELAGQARQQEQEEKKGEVLLEYTPEGVFITLPRAGRMGHAEQEALAHHLSQKRIEHLDKETFVRALTSEPNQRWLIAPAQQEYHYDESCLVTISGDLMKATLTLLPPEPGFGRRLAEVDVLQEIAHKYHIAQGLDRDAVHRLMEHPVYEQPVVIAKGVPPVTGKDGRLEYHFERRTAEEAYKVRQVTDDEKVDYKDLDLFTLVEKDQLLVTRVPPEEGFPGYTVTGRELPAESGKNYLLPRGRNTYITQDGLELRADMSGRVEEVHGNVEICNFFRVPGDVDMGVGNINFDGDVVVEGNVGSDFSIRATGSIEVRGIVEAATLEAGTDIVVNGGLQGGGRGKLEAQGSVYVRFAEYATIHAGTSVIAESLLHCNVNCFGEVEVLGGRGSIVGGNVCAGTYIAAKYLGTSNGRATGLEVGLSPRHRMKIDETESQVAMLKKEMDRLQELITETADDSRANERQKKERMENVRQLLQCKKRMQECTLELQDLKGQLESGNKGQIHALQIAYPGVYISIGLNRMIVGQQISYATFRVEGDAVQFTNCRFQHQPKRAKKKRR